MTRERKMTPQRLETPEPDGHEASPEQPLLDLPDAAIKKLIGVAKKRGYVTHEQINLLSKELHSEQIEDVLAMFSEKGVNVVESEATEDEGGHEQADDEDPDAETSGLVEIQPKVPTRSDPKEPIDRTDDPVRMYLREMGSAKLLSREGARRDSNSRPLPSECNG